jgi:lipoprotein signal peptidase
MTPNGVAFSVEAGDGWLSSCRGVLVVVVVVVVVVLFWWWNDDWGANPLEDLEILR